MFPTSQIPNPKSIERQFSYRYSWASTIGVLLTGGVGTLAAIWLAASKGISWMWLLAFFFFSLLLLGLWIAVVNAQGKLKFIITKDGFYLPSIWKSNSYTYISFSSISKIEFLEVQGNIILQLSVGNKKFAITHTWFPNRDDFTEIVETAKERLPSIVS